MKRKELIKLYLDFFKSKNHEIIPSSSLIPENDPSVLFTTAGMHPLVPYLLGQKHPLGKRLASVQKCIRTTDIDEVGDEFHHTFFEMLGNWSLGDYFKKEAIEFSFEFLTKKLKLPVEKLAVTCFEGDKDAPKDEEAAEIWLKLGIPKDKIVFMPKSANWWGPAGTTGPCGPDTEMFFFVGKKITKESNPKSKPEEWCEIWNDVFMQYNKTIDGRFEALKQKNVDTGMGVERTLAIVNGINDDYLTETFMPLIEIIEKISKKKYGKDKEETRSMRIIADHIKAATFILGDEKHIAPSNVDQGYILRRLIRRAVRHARILGVKENFVKEIAKEVIKIYAPDYPELNRNKNFIFVEIEKEENKFRETLEKGLKKFEEITKDGEISGKEAFLLYQSFGFPLEIIEELAVEKNIRFREKDEFNKEFLRHQDLSRIGAEKRFRGGLGEVTEETIKLHTATHLLNEALRRVISKDIVQKGSNITPERLRFDFNYDKKLTDEQLKAVEQEVNNIIKKALPVEKEEMSVEEAKKIGAQAQFGAKYTERVSVYKIGNYSIEICAGPHVKNTKELGHFKIIKEEGIAAGIRRIKAVLE
ncbi:MAG: alanine--tRNA ligase [Candidatus Pacearchaeota archaeon]